MDLHVVSVISLQHSLLLLLTSSTFQDCQTVQFPTNRYSQLYSAKEIKEDVKKRRQHARWMETISLKPPPKDWPEPTLGSGDFFVIDQTQATSTSPLNAYQAKLEQEFMKQEQEKAQGTIKLSTKKLDVLVSSLWTSSEEDFKKLLDPDELVKHNKQLKPFVNQGVKQQSNRVKGQFAQQQGKNNRKISTVESLKALKVNSKKKAKAHPPKTTTETPSDKGGKKKDMQGDLKNDNEEKKSEDQQGKESRTVLKKTKKKSKTLASKVTTKKPSRRGRRRKDTQKVLSQNLTPSKELKKPRAKSKYAITETSKPKKQRKKVQKFTFATQHFKKSNNDDVMDDGQAAKTNKSKHSTPIPEVITAALPITPVTKQVKAKMTKSTVKITLQNKTKTSSDLQSATSIAASQTEIQFNNNNTDSSIPITVLSVFPTHTMTTFATIPSMTSTSKTMPKLSSPTVITGSDRKRNETREKRKQLKQEMKNVIKAEQLEGSFGDKDSDWTSSEKRTILISNVTPKHALMGILRNKIVNFIDEVLKESPNLTEEQRRLNEKKFTKWNATYTK